MADGSYILTDLVLLLSRDWISNGARCFDLAEGFVGVRVKTKECNTHKVSIYSFFGFFYHLRGTLCTCRAPCIRPSVGWCKRSEGVAQEMANVKA